MDWQRSSGVLLHPTSLPSPFGIGDLGPEAETYADWLAKAGVGWWQVLPLNPHGPGYSPYSAPSTFAGNPLLISPELLLEDELIEADDLTGARSFADYEVDYESVIPWKETLLRKAHARFREGRSEILAEELDDFRARHREWLEDFALFAALKRVYGGQPWHRWPLDLAHRRPAALGKARRDLEEEVAFAEFCQLLFFRQWSALRTRANQLGVRILGDVPIFVDHDSAEVWAHRELFQLDAAGRPTMVAGVPPDYFSETGQLWGNPLYDWKRLAEGGFGWWVARLRHTLELVDAVRLDHFRGFVAHWEVPVEDTVATNGRWVQGPGHALFDAVAAALGDLPFVAEDLGFITDDVHLLRRALGLPGMAILHFAFSPEPRSSYIPYALTRDLVVYTGSHDNNTTVGWFLEDASEEEKDLVCRYAGCDGEEIHWDLIRLALGSVADLAIVPHQDLAGLGADCRMNTPGVAEGNWRFRITQWMLDDEIHERLAYMIWVFGRRPPAESAESG